MVNPNQIGAAIDLVRAWVAAGADPETHIFPAISEALLKADRPIRALSFFDGWVRASVAKGLKSQDKKWEEAMLGILGKDAFEAIAQSKPTRSTGDGYNRDAITNMPEAFAEGAYKSKNEHSRVNVPGEVENRSQGNTEARRSIGGDFGVYA